MSAGDHGAVVVFFAILGVLILLAATALGQGYLAWVIAGAVLLLLWLTSGVSAWLWFLAVIVVWGAAAIVLGNAPLRRRIASPLLMKIVGGLLPRMGDTEREALEAGTVWWDAELFSGLPRWDKMLAFQPQLLSEKERAFLEGPVEQLCRMLDDWEVIQAGDLSPEVWEFLKREGFLGMIIPEAWGGLGFSARAHSAVIAKLSSHCVTAAVTVMVPNSLGPAELLLHYGTEEQKRHYLPRLAKGEDIPCFALTGPENGSDAAAMRAEGVVCMGEWKGAETLGIRLSWNKRYTTLSSAATLLGLAFKLKDPDNLLGDDPEPGITCALIPTDLPGITIGERHDPLGVPFLNGPNQGQGVFVPVDAIIGGQAMAGNGWRMLMDCLAAGRSISLPSLAVGSAQLVTRLTGAYATIREQFNLPIGRFEGIAERLGRIGGMTYMMDATRTLTAGAVDAGEKPAVLSAVCKCYLTEGMRVVVNDGMDILGGAAISRGPRNVLSRAYQAVPIGITVEGANILTRTLIVFGQGAIRCHPFVHEEMEAVAHGDLARFDKAFFGHVNFMFSNGARSLLLGLVDGGAANVRASWRVRRTCGKLNRLSSVFALLTDAAMVTLGGELKRREMLSGRMADALAWMYMTSATLKRWVDDGEPAADRAVMRWATDQGLAQARAALVGAIDNLPNRLLAWKLRVLCFPLGTRHRPPKDKLSVRIAADLLDGNELRDRLTGDIYVPDAEHGALGVLEAQLATIVAAQPAGKKLRDAVRDGRLPGDPARDLYARAVKADVLTPQEEEQLAAADRARDEAIQVDSFDEAAFAALRG
jgi:acyl-CoA dehydrogenase